MSMNLFSSEEKDRRARERARKETAEACCLAEQAGISDSDFYDGAPSPPRFRPAQIALGAVGFLFALLALIYKRYLIPKSKKPSSLCIDSAKTVTFKARLSRDFAF